MKHLGQIIAALGVAAALVGGCKGKAGDDKKAGGAPSGKFASCDVIASAMSCKQYAGGNLAIGTDHLKQICDAVKGTFADAPCPAAKQIGSCAKLEGTDVYYEGYPLPVADVEKSCTTSEGTWKKP